MSFRPYAEYKNSGVKWLGAVPRHWEVTQFKRLVEIQNGSDYKHVETEDGYPVIGSGGPFTFATDYLHDGESVLLGRKGTIDKPLHVTGRFWTVDTMYWTKIRDGICGRFAYFTALTIPFSYYSTSTALPSMTQGALNGHQIGLPPIAEQEAITGFLDREVGKIDGLVAEQERLIALLKEKRQAVISHAVTKGLNPHAPMRESGIEWLGQIPVHWEATAIKRVIEIATSGPRGWSELAAEDGSFFFQSQNIGRNMEADFSEGKRITVPEGPDAERASLRVDDVVVCITGGRTGAVAHINTLEEDAFINQHVCLVRPINGQALGRYLAYGLFGLQGQEQLRLAMYGLKQGLNLENVREVVLPLPPITDQAAIVEYLDRYSNQVLELQREAQSAITLLQERRAALISAAVTGKIDVRAAAKKTAPAAGRMADLPPLRSVVGSYAILRFGKLGRMVIMKIGYLAQAHAGLDLGGHYIRDAAGPYDRNLRDAMEHGAAAVCGIATKEPTKDGGAVTYTIASDCRIPHDELTALAGADRAKAFEAMLTCLKGLNRDNIEAIATLYAVWNDLLADGKRADDGAICAGVLNDWDPEKRVKFTQDQLMTWLDWMRRNGFIPNGTAPRTDHQGSLFA